MRRVLEYFPIFLWHYVMPMAGQMRQDFFTKTLFYPQILLYHTQTDNIMSVRFITDYIQLTMCTVTPIYIKYKLCIWKQGKSQWVSSQWPQTPVGALTGGCYMTQTCQLLMEEPTIENLLIVRKSRGEGYTRKAVLLLLIIIQLTSPLLCEGVGEGVGGCGCWCKGWCREGCVVTRLRWCTGIYA